MVRTISLIDDILYPFLQPSLLLEGLIKSEVAEAAEIAENIRWRIRSLNDDEVEFRTKTFQTLLENQPHKFSGIPQVGIPAGRLGIHAFYIILENYIRNLFKNEIAGAGQITMNLRIFDRNRVDKAKGRHADKQYTVRLWAEHDSTSLRTRQETETLVNFLNRMIDQGIVDDEGKLIREGWGVKEMLVAAARLRACPVMYLQEHAGEVLRCVREGDCFLGYEFDLLRPLRTAIFVRQHNMILDSSTDWNLLGASIHETRDVSKIAYPIVHEYRLVVGDIDGGTDRNLGNLPPKIMVADSIPNPNELIEAEMKCEKDLAKQLAGRQKFRLSISGFPSQQTLQHIPNDNDLRVIAASDSAMADADPENEFTVVFDRHGYLANETARYQADAVFWEPVEAGTPTYFLLTNPPRSEKALLHHIWSVIASAALKIAVIDERLQETMAKQVWTYEVGQVSLSALEVLRKMRIYIPGVEQAELKVPTIESLLTYVREIRPHVLTIHAGILDKLGGKRANEALALLHKLQSEMDNTFQRVVVHSGRGIPVNVPERLIPFVSYASIESCLASKGLKSKYVLAGELLSARGGGR